MSLLHTWRSALNTPQKPAAHELEPDLYMRSSAAPSHLNCTSQTTRHTPGMAMLPARQMRTARRSFARFRLFFLVKRLPRKPQLGLRRHQRIVLAEPEPSAAGGVQQHDGILADFPLVTASRRQATATPTAGSTSIPSTSRDVFMAIRTETLFAIRTFPRLSMSES